MKLGGSAHKVFTQGILARDGPDNTLKNWMDRDVSKLDGTGELYNDDGAVALYKTDGTYQEAKGNAKRY